MNTHKHKSIVEFACDAIIHFMGHNIKFNAYLIHRRIQQYNTIEVSRSTINNYISKLYKATALRRESNPDNGNNKKFGHRSMYVYAVNTDLVNSNSHAFLVQCIKGLQSDAVTKSRKNRKSDSNKAKITALQKDLKQKIYVIKVLQQQLANQGAVVSTQEAFIDNQRSVVRDLNRNRSMSAEVLPAGTTDIAFKCVAKVINALLTLEISVDTPEYSHTIKKSEKI